MSTTIEDRQVRRRLAILRHAEEVTGNVSMTCRYYGITRQSFYVWKRRYEELGTDGLKDRSRRPKKSPNATTSTSSARSCTCGRTTTSARPRSRCTWAATTT
jgi:transposase-like protein